MLQHLLLKAATKLKKIKHWNKVLVSTVLYFNWQHQGSASRSALGNRTLNMYSAWIEQSFPTNYSVQKLVLGNKSMLWYLSINSQCIKSEVEGGKIKKNFPNSAQQIVHSEWFTHWTNPSSASVDALSVVCCPHDSSQLFG